MKAEAIEVSSAVIRGDKNGIRRVWITGKQGEWNTQQNIADVHRVGELLVLCNTLNHKPFAVLADDIQLLDWVELKTGIRPCLL